MFEEEIDDVVCWILASILMLIYIVVLLFICIILIAIIAYLVWFIRHALIPAIFLAIT